MSMEKDLPGAAPRNLPGATVLQIVPSLEDDHDGREVIDLALALVRTGARAMVASPEGALVSELQSFGGEWIAHASETRRLWRRPRTLGDMLEHLLTTERIDIVHARGVQAAKSALEAIGPFGTRLVLGCDEEALGHGRDPAFSRALLRGDRILTPSGYLADQLIDAHRIPHDRAVVIPRRIDTSRFDPANVPVERVAGLRHAWNMLRGERIVLVPGPIDPGRGQHILIEAVRILVNGGLERLVFVLAAEESSDPVLTAGLTARAEAYGIAHLVRPVGVCPDMPAAYAAADFVALPATAPPTFARSAGEALAMGRPVVASDVGALPELVLAPPRAPESARTGWLVVADDPLALARGLAAVERLEVAGLRSIGARARRLATALLSPGRIVASVLNVYAGLLAAEE